MLQLIGKIFDPLGILGPFVIRLKILFQELWRLHLAWDEPLPNQLQTTWNACLAQLTSLQEISLPRCVFASSKRAVLQLHIFADASLAAYGTVAYVRSINENGSIHVMYLCSKNRVAPLKNDNSMELTLPKLELTAALIAARLANFLNANLNSTFDRTYLWSDSQITLQWISNDDRKFKPYVAHRVREIRRITRIADWRHCPGKENPADLLTRGINGNQLLHSSTWINGPSWLSNGSDNWPEINFIVKSSCPLLCLQVTAEAEVCTTNEPLFAIENFSCYRRIVRITAHVLRFIDRLRRKHIQTAYLSSEEIQRAETYWIKFVQSRSFHEEVAALQTGKSISKSSAILTLNPMIDENNVIHTL